MCKVKWFKVFVSNTNRSISAQLNGFKRCKWLNNSIWPRDGTLTGTITPDQSGRGINGNEGVFYISKAPELEPHHQRVSGLGWFGFMIYMVHSIGFQIFFVQAFKIVVDSWKFSRLLLYSLWDDWPIFMISPTVAIGIHSTKAWLSQLGKKYNLDVRTLYKNDMQ